MKTKMISCALAGLFAVQIAMADTPEANVVGAKNGNVVVYKGADAIRKELEVLQQVISDTAAKVIAGHASKTDLANLVSRKTLLQSLDLNKAAQSQQPAQSATLTGCGQTLQLNATAWATPGGVGGATASMTATSNPAVTAFIQAQLYTIAKAPELNQVRTRYETFRINSAKVAAGNYPLSIISGYGPSFTGCSKAFVSGSISDASGDPLACGVMPVFIEEKLNAAPATCAF